MTDTSQQIRESLEPHGYRFYGSYVGVFRKTLCYAVFGPKRFMLPWFNQSQKTYQEYGVVEKLALIHFLNDKSQTGARLDDLIAMGYDPWISETTPVNDEGEDVGEYQVSASHMRVKRPRDWGHGVDSDSAIAALWLKVHNLEDPRKVEE